jgi:DNA helicase-2/ATP-dependent DNA helicase PcrA
MASPDEILQLLDPQQREVATTLGRPVVVIAGAGTGKTRAITHRIAYAAASGQQDPRAVLAVTFTTRAAGEMRARLARLGVPHVQARTFHSAALRQVRYFWPKVMGSPVPQVVANTLPLVADAFQELGKPADTALLRDVAGEVSWAKSANVGPDDYAGLADAAGRAVAGLEAHEVGRLLRAYERVKQARGMMDFDDILLAAAALLASDEHAAAEVRRMYRHFVVDEFQDVSPIQYALLKLWLGGRGDVCAVGDPAQSIHAFAGADRRFLLGFARDFPGTVRLELSRNYRSVPEVVAAANQVSLHSRGNVKTVRLVAERARLPDAERALPAVLATVHEVDADELDDLVAWLRQGAAAGLAWQEMAVLFRVNSQAPAIEAALARAGIPYVVRGGERFYERPEVVRAIAALRAAARTAPDEPAAGGVGAVLAGLGWAADPPDGSGRAREQWESWQAIAGLAEESGGATLADFVAALEEREQLQHVPESAGVALATLHASKGLEWRAVALVGLEEGTLPFLLAATPEQLAEENRLLYVGVTRARDFLKLSWARRAAARRASRQASRFLDGVVLPAAP